MFVLGQRGRRILLAILTSLWASASMAEMTLSEAQAKAAFLLNFARYVEWPAQSFASPESPIVICLVGRDPLGVEIGTMELQSKYIQGHPVKIRSEVTSANVSGCHVAFIPESEDKNWENLLRSFSAHQILTVSDMDGFINRGGAIGLIRVGEKLQFEINRHAIDKANLRASSNLLKLARNLSGLSR